MLANLDAALGPESEVRRVLASLTFKWSTLDSIPALPVLAKVFPEIETGANPRLGPLIEESTP